MVTGFVGTASGIFEFNGDEHTGIIHDVRIFCVQKNAKYLTFHENLLVSIYEDEKGSGVAIYDENANVVAKNIYETIPPCHVAVVEGFVYTSNYHTGVVTKLHFPTLEVAAIKSFGKGAGAHQVLGCGNKLLVPCLNLDKMFVLDADLNVTDEVSFPEKSGPRHGVVQGDKLYIVTELSDEVYEFSIKCDKFELKNKLKLFEDRVSGTAAVRMGEGVMFVSTRERNVLTAVDVSGAPQIIAETSCGGQHPRDIYAVGKCVFVANRDTGTLISFLFDGQNFKRIAAVKIKGCVAIYMKGEKV